MTVVNRSSGQTPINLIPPNVLAGQMNATPTNTNTPTALSQNDSVNLNVNIVPSNYPQVSNNIPANIFPQASTGVPTSPTGTTTPTGTNTALKPITMTEAQWAVKFEEKVQKQGYKPTTQEMAKYQDIVARYKANPKVDQSIVELLAMQSSSLGAQVASMRYGNAVADSLRGLKPGASAISSELGAVESAGGLGGSLKGLGGTLLKGAGLAAIVSGGFSLVTNGIQVLQGKKTWADVGGTVAADAANGAVSGLTGALAAGGAGLIVSAVGATGLAGTLIVGVGAMGGAWLGDKLFRGTGMYDQLKSKVDSFFAPSATAQSLANTSYQGAQTYKPSGQ
jgi:hypothetical protein